MPLHFTPEDRRRIATRLTVQPPQSQHDIDEFQKFMAEHKRIQGLPVDVLFVLESLSLLAEDGNPIAQGLITREYERYGITYAKRYL